MRALPTADEKPYKDWEHANTAFRQRLKEARTAYANLMHAFHGNPVSDLYNTGGRLEKHHVTALETHASKITHNAHKYQTATQLLLDVFERGINDVR